MANINFDPNARYDSGPNAAGAGRFSSPAPTTNTGHAADGTTVNSDIFHGFNCAGNVKTNGGPNAAGVEGSYNQAVAAAGTMSAGERADESTPDGTGVTKDETDKDEGTCEKPSHSPIRSHGESKKSDSYSYSEGHGESISASKSHSHGHSDPPSKSKGKY